MFRQRTSSQKPGDELLANFRQQFPQVATTTSTTTAPTIVETAAAENPSVTAPPPDRSHSIDDGSFHDQDPTPRASNEPWRFTPSLLDPNAFSYGAFGPIPQGYYTPTPGGTNTLFHPQAGDLHTPSLALGPGLGTPLSMPTSGDALQAGPAVMDMSGFQTLHPHQMHHFNPFIQAPPPQQGFAPSTFVHQDTGYETMEHDGSPLDSDPSEERLVSMEATIQGTASNQGFHSSRTAGMPASHPLPASAEKFRFHATLNAPTAMIKQADEIPVTYLNKGQAYSLSVVDTKAVGPVVPGTKYRTFVRVSFEDEQQRQKPGVCWGLWKEGRGTNEAHQRGGKLQAVEYVESGQSSEADEKRPRIEVESSSFDGFSITWTPGQNGMPEVNIAVRFNFLSTDFSHSKGVKGIPVRLCAKTSLIPPGSALPAEDADTETCFCKVKLFRDHGAERKLSNDVAHVKKSIDKLNQQISQAESGMKDFGKRKRSLPASKANDSQRPGKVPKHKRTWSISSASSAGGGERRMTVEEDLHFKLQILQDMFTSTRPVSVLYLRGEDLDDPDKHPVFLPGEVSPREKSDGGSNWRVQSGRSSIADSMASPSPSNLSLVSQASAVGTSGQWKNLDAAAEVAKKTSEQPSKVNKTDDTGKLSGWIEALGVDQSYRPPAEKKAKPVACFYVLRQNAPDSGTRSYHQAIYLKERTLRDFNEQVARKWSLETSKILRTLHVLESGLEVIVDDDVVQELKEGQDMTLDIQDIAETPAPVKREWDMAIDDDNDTVDPPPPAGGLILRLSF